MVSQQERLAQLLLEIFGDKIFLDHLTTNVNSISNEYRPLPSPNDLRGKIIIKVSEEIDQMFLYVVLVSGKEIAAIIF